MLFDPYIGWPQIAALVILVQRGFEELYSRRNTARLINEGAREVGSSFYPVVAITHLSWIAALYFLVPPDAPLIWPFLGVYVVLQALRYWVIASLGQFWTHRIVTLDGAPIVRRGPYRYVRHPNYLIAVVETLVLPWVFGAWALGPIMAAIWTSILAYKISLEDGALETRRSD